MGYWLPEAGLTHLDVDAEWVVLERLEWLAGPRQDASVLRFDALAEVLKTRAQGPTQIAQVVDHQIVARFFVVPDDFLARAQAALPLGILDEAP